MRRKRSRYWDTFLRIAPPNTATVAPLDEMWLGARGAGKNAPLVIGLLRDFVIPAVRGLQLKHKKHVSFFFLVHDYQSGVPVTDADKNAYIHLRLIFDKPMFYRPLPGSPWEMTRPVVVDGVAPSGIRSDLLIDHPSHSVTSLLVKQSQWVCDLIEAHVPHADPAKMILQTLQFLHYFSNMLQMRVA